MSEAPDDHRASSADPAETASPSSRRPVFVVAALLVAAVVIAVLVVTGDRGPEDPSEDDPRAAEGDADETSAARGPQGTRTFSEVPQEIPAAVLTEDASDVEATVARGGDDWSAVVTYTSGLAPAEIEATVDAALRAETFTYRQASFDGRRRVVVYDGPDGSIVTVTLTFEDETTLVGLVRVSA